MHPVYIKINLKNNLVVSGFKKKLNLVCHPQGDSLYVVCHRIGDSGVQVQKVKTISFRVEGSIFLFSYLKLRE